MIADLQPFVSVILPVRNEACCIEEVLRAVLAQDYPRDSMEFIVVDGLSDDGTTEIVRSLAAQDTRLKLTENPRRLTVVALNLAVHSARGEVIVCVGGHGVVPPNYVRECVAWLLRWEASHAEGPETAVRSRDREIADSPRPGPCSFAIVGGAWDCIGRGTVGQVIALATSSPFGVGNAQYRTIKLRTDPRTHGRSDAQKAVATDSVPFWAVRRKAFERIGLFREEMLCHEDYEFSHRLRQAGGKVFLLPWLRSRYYVRDNFSRLALQYWRYGFWKGRFLRSYPESLKFRHLVPPLFVAVLVVLAATAFAGRAGQINLAILLGVYLGFVLLAATLLSFTRSRDGQAADSSLSPRASHPSPSAPFSFRPATFLLGPVVFTTLHFCWGTGVWLGLARGPVTGQPPRL